MRSMIWKSTFREIKESLGRFLAILAIVALGVGFFAGLKVTQPAMLKTAQRYFDKTALYDYRLISTVGFSEDEVETIKKQKDVKAAEGAVTFDIVCESGGKERVLKMQRMLTGWCLWTANCRKMQGSAWWTLIFTAHP